MTALRERLARRGAGFTLLELIVVISVVALVASVAADRLLRYWEQAEKAAMEQTVGAMKSAMQLRIAAFVVNQRASEAKTLLEQNPIDWLAENPGNYAGALFAPEVAQVRPGSWYYDRRDGALVYQLNRTRYFVPGRDGEPRIRFRTAYRESADGVAGAREVMELGIRPVEPYNWFVDRG